ncbi:MAG: pyruvate kinase [Firmicutes bacterium]|nr:pyruvate kinase [Bacillota bacterium]
MRRTKIVCTIGPASTELGVLKTMLQAGMNVARLNFSHGTHAEHKERIELVRRASDETGLPVAILLDTKGPEIRLGTFKNGKVQLVAGQKFTLTTRELEGDENRVSVNHADLPEDVEIGRTVLIDDGLVELVVEAVAGSDINCRVVNGGEVSNRKSVNLPGSKVSMPALSEQDIADILFGIEQGLDFIAASFVRDAGDILAIRRLLEEHDSDIPIIAKIENRQGLDNLDSILKVADGLMVARGDLGVEIPPEEVPLAQKDMIRRCNLMAKPVITATQMLDSMIRNPRPTRAEASDVANAIFDGTDAIMLSGETAAGRYPVESVATMARLAIHTEQSLECERFLAIHKNGRQWTVTDSISFASRQTAQQLGASAIITSTQSGHTARMVSKYRPVAPVIAVTPKVEVMRRLLLTWGVMPLIGRATDNTDQMIYEAITTALRKELIKKGDLVVITAGVPVGVPGTTNLLKVHVVGDVVVRGQGIGSRPAFGPVIVAKNARELKEKAAPGKILVTHSTDREMVQHMEGIIAIIAEEGGLTSHAAILGLELGIPVVSGAEGATGILGDGQVVSIDTGRGLVYRGQANVAG